MFYEKTDDVFKKKEICKNEIKKDVDYLVVDFHGEIISEKCCRSFF